MREQYTLALCLRLIFSAPRFNRSHGHKTTFSAGKLIPFYVDEALPGDTFNVKASLFARLATPIVPIMDNMHMDVFFAVPNRLVWDNWQKFMGEQENPGDSTDYRIPQCTVGASGWQIGDVGDYFGLPVHIGNVSASALFSALTISSTMSGSVMRTCVCVLS